MCSRERLDFQGLETEPGEVVDGIVSLGKSVGLEVNDADVEELVENHRTEMSTEVLKGGDGGTVIRGRGEGG